MYLLGTTLGVSAACYALVVAGCTALLRWGRVGIWSALLWVSASAALLLLLFLLQRYDIRYVYDYSSRELELHYRIAAVWAGLAWSVSVRSESITLC